MCNLLKKLFNLETKAGEPEKKKVTDVKCVGERKCLFIAAKKNILILPDTILHIRLSSPMHKNISEFVDITGRFSNCRADDNKWIITLDTSKKFTQDTRSITIYPKSWDGYTDVSINGFHIDYDKAKNDNCMRIEERILYLLSHDGDNKLFLTNLEATFIDDGEDNFGRLVSCCFGGDQFDFRLYYTLDCSSEFNRNIKQIPIENLYTIIPLASSPTCILTDSSWDANCNENKAVMDVDIVKYLDDNLDKLIHAF